MTRVAPDAEFAPVPQTSSAATRGGSSPAFLFIIGAPRSGTSWIQKSLAEQPGWVTVPELHYATEVLRPVLRAWTHRVRALEQALTTLERSGRQPTRLIGMPASLELDDLVRALRAPFDSLVARASATYGEVAVFVEKTPGNSVLTPYLFEVLPGAYMLHVVRDPRSMVRSLRAASGSEWGIGWAPRSVLVAALIWRSYVAGARRANCNTMQYLEVRYEDARRSLPTEITRIRSWLGWAPPDGGTAPVEASGRHEIVSSRVAAVVGAGMVGEPEGFGDGSGTRPELAPHQLWLVEAVTARLMEECGYAVRYRTAKWANRVIEALASPVLARLPAGRKEALALNLRRLRPACWARERIRRRR